MLKSVVVTNSKGESLTMELRNPEKSGFLITSIDGLGAPTANINVTNLAAIDGGYYNSSHAQTRNIVLNIRFFSELGSDVESLRHKTYKYFPIKKNIKLRFESDERIGEIYGYVEKNEPNIFSKETDCQISIICPFPYFYDVLSGNQYLRFSNVVPVFQFYDPNRGVNELNSSSEFGTEYGKHIIFSELNTDYQTNIYYNGDADIGLEATFTAHGTVLNPQLYNASAGETLIINTTLNAGDRLIINSARGEKSIKRLRNGNYVNLLNKMDRDSAWPTLQNGDNVIGFVADEGTANLALTINYRTLFEGM